MDAFHIDVTGDRQVGLRFEEFPDDLYANLKAEIGVLTGELEGLVEAAAPIREGKLQSQITSRVFADKNHIKGEVLVAGERGSQDFAKAAALEYGAHRATNVKAHAMRLDHAWANRLAAPETVMVAAYSRTPDIAEHRFERGPLAALAPEITAGLEAVVAKATAEANR